MAEWERVYPIGITKKNKEESKVRRKMARRSRKINRGRK
jgi:hypothetical protein